MSPVYVDDAFIPYGRMIMCHMIADTHEELIDMVDRIGVQRKWIQKEGTPEEHFDISKVKRDKAISLGAISVTKRDLVKRIRKKRLHGNR